MVYRLDHFVTSNTSVATGKNDTHAVFLTVEILLSEVGIRGRVAHENNRIALVNNLNGLVVTGDNGEDIVLQDKIGRADLMTLRGYNNGSSVELTSVTEVVKVRLETFALNRGDEVADSLLSANDCGRLAARSSLNMGDEV